MLKRRKFGEPAGPPLKPIKYKPGELTSLRHDQVERRRKVRKKQNSKLFKPYHKRKDLQPKIQPETREGIFVPPLEQCT